MNRIFNFKNILIFSCVLISIIASITDMRLLRDIYNVVDGKNYLMTNYSHIFFYGFLGVIFYTYSVAFIRGLFYILLFAVSLELLQSFSPIRNVDIDDVLMSLAGWISGYIFFLVLNIIINKISKTEGDRCVR